MFWPAPLGVLQWFLVFFHGFPEVFFTVGVVGGHYRIMLLSFSCFFVHMRSFQLHDHPPWRARCELFCNGHDTHNPTSRTTNLNPSLFKQSFVSKTCQFPYPWRLPQRADTLVLCRKTVVSSLSTFRSPAPMTDR